MRVISQDGSIDIPYEQVVITRYEENIYFLNKNLTGVEQLTDDIEIATYSTIEKAKKAMRMLQDSYVGCLWTETHYDYSAQANVSDLVMNNIVFQFPADEDVEV